MNKLVAANFEGNNRNYYTAILKNISICKNVLITSFSVFETKIGDELCLLN